MIIKFINSFKTIGIKKTIIKSINYVSIKNYKRRKLKKKIFNIQSFNLTIKLVIGLNRKKKVAAGIAKKVINL